MKLFHSFLIMEQNLTRLHVVDDPMYPRMYVQGKWLVHVEHGHTHVVQLLIERGADLNKVDDEGETPLIKAASSSRKYVVKVLLDGGADPDEADKLGHTSLHEAASKGDKDVIQALIDGGADINKASKDGSTPPHKAAKTRFNSSLNRERILIGQTMMGR